MRRFFAMLLLSAWALVASLANTQPAQAYSPMPLPPPSEVYKAKYVFVQNEIVLPPKCRNIPGKIRCVSMTDRKVYAVKNGIIINSGDARFGGIASDGTGPWKTCIGTFKVNWKSPSRISNLYFVRMDFVLNFCGGQHIHFSEEFKDFGWKYGSHGCVGLSDRAFAKWLYNWSPVGSTVIVTKS